MSKCRIAVNTRLLLPNKLEGIGRFTHEILKRLCEKMPETDFVFFFDRPFDPNYIYHENCRGVVLSPPTRHPVLWNIWFDYQLPRAFKKHKIDLFLSPDGFLSRRTEVPQIAVIHDLNFVRKPENLQPSHRSYYLKKMPLFAQISNPLLTVSEYSKQDIHREYGITKDKIEVVYNGVSEFFTPLNEDERSLFKNEDPYFLFVGAFNPRKNLNGLFKAFEEYKESGGPSKLCVAGDKMFLDAELKAAFESMKWKDEIRFFGRASDQELRQLYGHAQALILPSFEEGFGIPIIEAMSCGTAVICSDRSAMPEVAEEAALLIDPNVPKSISVAMKRLEEDEGLIGRLREKGLERARTFSWDESAAKLESIIRKRLMEC